MMKYKHKNENDTLVEMRFLEGVSNRLGDHEGTLKALGDLYTRAGFIEKGLRTDLQLVALCPEDPMVWYNLGCSYALSGETDSAFDALNRAVDLEYLDVAWMLEDDDLKALRGDMRFEKLLLRMAEAEQEQHFK